MCWLFYLPFEAKVIEGHVYKSYGSRRKKYSGQKSVKETLPVRFLTVVHLLLIKTMSEGGLFI